ncbi:MAG TPA: response regulator [Polyangiaceae bacterium]|nr:response regulator [Polyangiaceae bacterium]
MSNRPHKRLVLLVEDEPSLRRQVAEHLTRAGLEVVAVTDGHAALSMIRERRPDLVCLDLRLPRISGYEVCEQIRVDPDLRDVAVLMTSERFSLEVRAHSYEAGADGYIDKPYTLDQLTKEVTRLMSRRRAPSNEL